MEMAAATNEDLVRMGIPLFGTRVDLIMKEGEERAAAKEKVTMEELMVLQKRMLELLEDLCKD